MIELEIKRLEGLLKNRELSAFNAIFGQWFLCKGVYLNLLSFGLNPGFKVEDIPSSILYDHDFATQLLRYSNYLHMYLSELVEFVKDYKNLEALKLVNAIKDTIQMCLEAYLKYLKSLSTI